MSLVHTISYCNEGIVQSKLLLICLFVFHFVFVCCPVIQEPTPTVLALVSISIITSSGTLLFTSCRIIPSSRIPQIIHAYIQALLSLNVTKYFVLIKLTLFLIVGWTKPEFHMVAENQMQMSLSLVSSMDVCTSEDRSMFGSCGTLFFCSFICLNLFHFHLLITCLSIAFMLCLPFVHPVLCPFLGVNFNRYQAFNVLCICRH